MIADLLRKIIYNIYSWPLSVVLITSTLTLILWTVINAFVPKRVGRIINLIALFAILTAVLFFTITNRSVKPTRKAILTPFMSYTANGFTHSSWLNVLFFFPLGLSLPYILADRTKHKVKITIITALVFSTFIEIIQYIFALGLCETDDVIMNTIGAAIGTLSYITCIKLQKRKSEVTHDKP